MVYNFDEGDFSITHDEIHLKQWKTLKGYYEERIKSLDRLIEKEEVDR